MNMLSRGGDPQPAYMLHHDLHMTWGQARLNYWLFSFRPIYERAAIFDRLAAVLHEHGITSYFAYELLGHYDILLRAWVPKSVLTSDLEDALDRGLSSGLAARVDIASL